MNREAFDLYVDYLMVSTAKTTATGLSDLLEGAVSHDKITRSLSERELTSKDLWKAVKPLIREIESKDAVLIVDDTIEEKPYTDESELICWHYDHSKKRNVKGILLLSVIYSTPEASLPVAFDTVRKTETRKDPKTGKVHSKSPITKNERYQNLLRLCQGNQISYRYILNDVWYASCENMRFVKESLKKDFVMPLKSNRYVALSKKDKLSGRWKRVDELVYQEGKVYNIYLEGVPFALLLTRKVFINGDGSVGILYLVTSDLNLSGDQMNTIYQRRWKVEEYHKSLKSNASLAKSPTHTVMTQTNHLFASLCAYIKLESLKIKTSLNHFALKAKIYLVALQAARKELISLKPYKLNYA